MTDNERLEQIISKLDEIEALSSDLNRSACSEELTTLADNAAWETYMRLRQPGPHRTALRQMARAYECMDEAYIDLACYHTGNAYEMNKEAAERMAKLLPMLQKALARLQIFPIEEAGPDLRQG